MILNWEIKNAVQKTDIFNLKYCNIFVLKKALCFMLLSEFTLKLKVSNIQSGLDHKRQRESKCVRCVNTKLMVSNNTEGLVRVSHNKSELIHHVLKRL